MFIITFIFSGLFLQVVVAQYHDENYLTPGIDIDPEPEWAQKYQKEFDQIGAANFSLVAAHILHGLTVEDAMTSFNIKMSNENGIPAVNPDLSVDESNALLANVPSRPSEYISPGMHGFVDFMDHVTDPDWIVPDNKLQRLLHTFHMHETWAIARKAANDLSGVSDDICIGALDHANNGIEKVLKQIFIIFKSRFEKLVLDEPLTWDDNGDSWAKYKADQPFRYGSNHLKSMGLYTQCLMRKFWDTEQPIELEGCCESKTVGNFTYTLVSAGKVLSGCKNSCIYTRKDRPGSQYCFAEGEQKVQCLG